MKTITVKFLKELSSTLDDLAKDVQLHPSMYYCYFDEDLDLREIPLHKGNYEEEVFKFCSPKTADHLDYEITDNVIAVHDTEELQTVSTFYITNYDQLLADFDDLEDVK